MLKRVLLLGGSAVALISAIVIAVYASGSYRAQQKLAEYEAIYEEAGELLEASRPGETLALLEAHFKPSLVYAEMRQWPLRMIDAALQSRNYSHLEHLVAEYPDVLLKHESAALWWARAQMHRRFWSKAEQLIRHWPESEREFPYRWYLLEADRHLLAGEHAAAEALLRSWVGEGHDEVNRQLRLALLADGDAGAVQAALTAAYVAMPNSAELRLTSAQFLERSGNLALARREYVAAYLLAPENPFHGHQLAAFYLRMRALPQAVATWRQTYERTEDPRAWWNVWFWERVTLPRGEPQAPAAGNWWGNLPFILSETGESAFLSDALLAGEVPPILAEAPAYHWLLALEHLRRREEASALEVLEGMPDSELSASKDLRTLLTALLNWRVRGNWPRDVVLGGGQFNHRFLRFLENYRPGNAPAASGELTPLERFLNSPEAPGALLLAHGWLGAADRLLPDGLGDFAAGQMSALDWLPFAFCKMKGRLEGPQAAIMAAADFPEDVAVQGLKAEMLLSDRQIEAGLDLLRAVSQVPGEAGYRASYLLGLSMLERRQFADLEALMAERVDLAESVSGRELQARVAQLRGAPQRALEIYTELGDDSVEGCVYRYRSALARDDRSAARAILETLLRLAPNEPTFHQWMRDLDAENG